MLEHRTDAAAELLGLVGGVGLLGDDPVDDAAAVEVERAHLLGARHLGGVVEVAVHDRGGALGRQRRQPRVLRGDDPVGGQQRERAAAVALAQHQAQRGRVEGDEVGQPAGDLAGQAAVLGVGATAPHPGCR